MVNAQEWLDQKYPTKESKAAVTKLEISEQELKTLTGKLDLTSFPNLPDLNFLIVSGKKERNWQSFYNWLNTNIVDFNERGAGKGNIKAAKRSEYPNLISVGSFCVGSLMNSLENILKIAPLDYTGDNSHNKDTTLFLSYEDNKTFFQLASGNDKSFKFGWVSFTLPDHQNILTEYEKLLKNWRDSTIITTTLSIKLPTNLAKVTELETKIKDLQIENENLWKELTPQAQQEQLPKGNN